MISKITGNLTWRTEKSPFLIGKSSINGPFPVRYVSLLETGGYVKWIMRNCDVGFGKASWRNHDCDSRTLWNLPMYGPNEQIQVPPFAIIRHSSPIPIGSMYAIYGNIYHQYTPNVRHGSYGIWTQCFPPYQWYSHSQEDSQTAARWAWARVPPGATSKRPWSGLPKRRHMGCGWRKWRLGGLTLLAELGAYSYGHGYQL